MAKRHSSKRNNRKKRAGALASGLPEEELLQAFRDHSEGLIKRSVNRVRKDLEQNPQRWPVVGQRNHKKELIRVRLQGQLIEEFCMNFHTDLPLEDLAKRIEGRFPIERYYAKCLMEQPEVYAFRDKSQDKHLFEMSLEIFLREHKAEVTSLLQAVRASFSPDVVTEALSENPKYGEMTRPLARKITAWAQLSADFRESTPENYALFFPEARGMERHFILHIGPTNSGKTYQAIKQLEEADRGVYLAPLRLLAYEQFERINADGVYCSMITGEERILVPEATHQSSTIEMWDPTSEWDVAVIDEAQMIGDEERGSAWTNAILGVLSPVVHLCASPDATKCLIRMIESCGDTYEIVSHQRMTPLLIEKKEFEFPEDVEEGDALIVFSRRDVHGVAADLKQNGIACSIIYGALPYDVRHKEAEAFALGEKKVVVATDAIGMGMNLPIRRVVFLQQDKFDGKSRRELNSAEVRQIAGRAGRYGIYDTGLVQSYGNLERITELLHEDPPEIEKAVIGIPSDFFEREGRVSDILSVWNELPATQDYDKGNIEEKIAIARDLEAISDNKPLVRRFIRFSVDRDSRDAYEVMKRYYDDLCCGERPDIEATLLFYDPDVMKPIPRNMQDLESMYKVYDFLFAYAIMNEDESVLKRIVERKASISDKLTVILNSGYVAKSCKVCGRRLTWNYPYGVCQKCFRSGRYR